MDFEKVHDMVSIDTLLLKMLKLGVKGVDGQGFDFILSFLAKRSFQVHLCSMPSIHVQIPCKRNSSGEYLEQDFIFHC